MLKEIGSEFQTNYKFIGKNNYLNLIECEKRVFISGRSSLLHVCDDIVAKFSKKFRIALPYYCCGSMIDPFRYRKIEISFYDLNTYKEVINAVDVVLVMGYFGFYDSNVYNIAKYVKNRGKLLIIDATQTALSKFNYYKFADYLVSSNRKWCDSLSSFCYSKIGFTISYDCCPYTQYINIWREAADSKYAYFNNLHNNKDLFLLNYSKANKMLYDSFENYGTSQFELNKINTFNTSLARRIRRSNASYLIKNLKNDNISLIYDKVGIFDCPLFVPILVKNNKRDKLKKILINNNIYCPIHWPKDSLVDVGNLNIYNEELSLICDHRYDLNDMKKIINIINNFD